MNRQKKIIYFLIFLFFSGSLTAEVKKESSSASSEKWVLAAVPFTFANLESPDEAMEAVAKSIPSLILEQISSETVRLESNREVLNQKLADLRNTRLSLFLELSKAEKARNALAIGNYTKRKYNKLLKEQNDKIEDIRKKISKNLVETAENSLEGQKKESVSSFSAFFAAFRNSKDISTPAVKKISLYKDDSAILFTRPNFTDDSFFSSYSFEKSVTGAGINALLSGSITSYGGYAAVTAELRTYPGGSICASVTEVGLLSAPLQIAKNLCRSLTPALSNKPPVLLDLKIEPEQIAKNVSLNADGIVFTEVPESLVLDSGNHKLTFEAEGYRRVSLDYDFSGKKTYSVTVKMQEKTSGKVVFKLSEPISGVLSTDALNSFEFSTEKNEADVLVDGHPVIARFLSDEGFPSFFYIPMELLDQSEPVVVKPLKYDVSKNIEKRRRRMYTAYSAFIISLPFSFYYYGNYINKLNGNVNGLPIAPDDVNNCRDKALFSISVSVSLGALFGIELVRYLHSTNDVLPGKAKLEKVKK